MGVFTNTKLAVRLVRSLTSSEGGQAGFQDDDLGFRRSEVSL